MFKRQIQILFGVTNLKVSGLKESLLHTANQMRILQSKSTHPLNIMTENLKKNQQSDLNHFKYWDYQARNIKCSPCFKNQMSGLPIKQRASTCKEGIK